MPEPVCDAAPRPRQPRGAGRLVQTLDHRGLHGAGEAAGQVSWDWWGAQCSPLIGGELSAYL